MWKNTSVFFWNNSSVLSVSLLFWTGHKEENGNQRRYFMFKKKNIFFRLRLLVFDIKILLFSQKNILLFPKLRICFKPRQIFTMKKKFINSLKNVSKHFVIIHWSFMNEHTFAKARSWRNFKNFLWHIHKWYLTIIQEIVNQISFLKDYALHIPNNS